MSDIFIASRDEAIDILMNKMYNVSTIISISNIDQQPPFIIKEYQKNQEKTVLIFNFNDIDDEIITDNYAIYPKKEHIISIIEHSNKILNSEGLILCHCKAGISRSAAVAFILKSIELGVGNEQQALTETLKIKKLIMPNKLMIKLADEILGNKWALSQALKQIKYLREQLN